MVIVAVSVDSPSDSQQLRSKLTQRGFQLNNVLFLHDESHRVIDRYGLLDYALWAPVPYPATFVLDCNGIVRWRYVDKDFRKRASPVEVICQTRRLHQPGLVCEHHTFDPGFDHEIK